MGGAFMGRAQAYVTCWAAGRQEMGEESNEGAYSLGSKGREGGRAAYDMHKTSHETLKQRFYDYVSISLGPYTGN